MVCSPSQAQMESQFSRSVVPLWPRVEFPPARGILVRQLSSLPESPKAHRRIDPDILLVLQHGLSCKKQEREMTRQARDYISPEHDYISFGKNRKLWEFITCKLYRNIAPAALQIQRTSHYTLQLICWDSQQRSKGAKQLIPEARKRKGKRWLGSIVNQFFYSIVCF